jgi:CDP-diacylglycerol--serine O-phosphatidyltransferase
MREAKPTVKVAKRRRAVYLIPNILTTGNLFCGLFAILSVYKGHYAAAAVSILVALVFDMLDGKSARWTNSTSQFGVEYDSLADLASFGVAPGFLIYAWALSEHDMAGAAVMFAFVACGALRLARYNVMSSATENRYFTGLPIPAAAGVIAASVVFDAYVLPISAAVKPVSVLVVTLLLAFLMVSTIKYRSFKDVKFRSGRNFNNLVWVILGLMLVAAWPQGMLFVVFAGYALLGVSEKIVGLTSKAMGRRVVGIDAQGTEPKTSYQETK